MCREVLNTAILGFANFSVFFNSALFTSEINDSVKNWDSSIAVGDSESSLALFFFLLGLGAGRAWLVAATRRFRRKSFLLVSSILFALVVYNSPGVRSYKYFLIARFLAGLTGAATVYLAPGSLMDSYSASSSGAHYRQLDGRNSQASTVITYTMCAGILLGILIGAFFNPAKAGIICSAIVPMLLMAYQEPPYQTDLQKSQNSIEIYDCEIESVTKGEAPAQSFLEGYFVAILYIYFTKLDSQAENYLGSSSCFITSFIFMLIGTGFAATIMILINVSVEDEESKPEKKDSYTDLLERKAQITGITLNITGVFMSFSFMSLMSQFNFLLPSIIAFVPSVTFTIALTMYGQYIVDLYSAVPSATSSQIANLICIRFVTTAFFYILIMELLRSEVVTITLLMFSWILIGAPAHMPFSMVPPTPSDKIERDISNKEKEIARLTQEIEMLRK